MVGVDFPGRGLGAGAHVRTLVGVVGELDVNSCDCWLNLVVR